MNVNTHLQVDQIDMLNLKLMLDVSFGGELNNLLRFLDATPPESDFYETEEGVPSFITNPIENKLFLNLSSIWIPILDEDYGDAYDLPKSNFYKMDKANRLWTNVSTLLSDVCSDNWNLLLAAININDINTHILTQYLENGLENEYTMAFEASLEEVFHVTASAPLSTAHILYLKDLVSQVEVRQSESNVTVVNAGGVNEDFVEPAPDLEIMKNSNVGTSFELQSLNPFEFYKSVQTEFGSKEFSDELIAGFERSAIGIVDSIQNKVKADDGYLTSEDFLFLKEEAPIAAFVEKYVKEFLPDALNSLRDKTDAMRDKYTEDFFIFMRKKVQMACLRGAPCDTLLSELKPELQFPAPFEVVDALYNVFGSAKDESRFYHIAPYFVSGTDNKKLKENLGIPFHTNRLSTLYEKIISIGDKLLQDVPFNTHELDDFCSVMGTRIRDGDVPKTVLILREYAVNGLTRPIDISAVTGVAQGNVSRTIARYEEYRNKAKFVALVLQKAYN